MHSLRFGQVNLGRGKLAKDDLLSEVVERGLDVVLILEPHVTKSGTFASLGKSSLRVINTQGEKPPAAVLVVNPSLWATLISQLSGSHLVSAEISRGNQHLCVGNVYFQFSEPTEIHVERLEEAVRSLNSADWIIVGDVNARSTTWNDTHTDKKGEMVEELMLSWDMICCHSGNTP